MSKDQFAVSVRWMIEREIALCAVLNRTSNSRMIKSFFVAVSRLGDGKARYVLIMTLPFVYGDSGLITSLNMIEVVLVNLVLYKLIKSLTGRARLCAVSTSIPA